jgi:hypothetical protein
MATVKVARRCLLIRTGQTTRAVDVLGAACRVAWAKQTILLRERRQPASDGEGLCREVPHGRVALCRFDQPSGGQRIVRAAECLIDSRRLLDTTGRVSSEDGLDLLL